MSTGTEAARSTGKVFFSGDTEARAVLAAANHYGVPAEQVVFERIEKRHGFVKRRRVVIRVDPARVGEAAAAAAEPTVEAESAAQAVAAAPKEAAESPMDAPPEPEPVVSAAERGDVRIECRHRTSPVAMSMAMKPPL